MAQPEQTQARTPQAELTQMIESGYKIIRLEGDQQRQMSKLDPRNEEKVLSDLMMEIRLAPECAEKLFYTLPFTKKDDDGNKRKENVQGLSIKGSMAIQRRWTNSASAGRIVEEQADYIICEGVFMDYETNNRVMRQVKVSRFYKPAGKTQMIPRRPDLLEMAIAAGVSKAIRNAVLNAVPEYIKIRFFEAAREITAKLALKKPLNERLAELVKRFSAVGIKSAEIAQLSDKVSQEDGKFMITEEAYLDLLGILNALEEGHSTKESLLEPEKAKKQEPPQEEVKLSDVL